MGRVAEIWQEIMKNEEPDQPEPIAKIAKDPFYRLTGKATAKQKEMLKKFDIEFHGNIGKQKASDLIKAHIDNNKRSNFSGTVFIGGGLIHYSHGIMDYCDDGNGQEWSAEDDDGENWGEY